MRTLLGALTLLAGPALSAQEPRPLEAMRALAAEECQPEQPRGIPAKARTALEHLKDQLGPWLLGRLRASGDRSPAQIEAELTQEFEALASATPNPEGSFWHPLDFQVEAPDGHPDLLTIQAAFGIDATLLVFQKHDGKWRLLLQDRAQGYTDIDGLFGDYTFALTPKGADGSFFLAAARITPWYQSNWREVEVRFLRVLPDGHVARIGSRQEVIFLGVDDPLEIRAEGPARIHMSWQGGSSDPGRHNFRRSLHWQLNATGCRRVPPYGETPVDLVDEWLSLPWREAAALLEPSVRARLKPLHARLSDRENNVLTFAEEVRQEAGACEVEADLERDDTTETYRFRIGEREGGLRLLDVQRVDR